ncbi:cob(I)yrinic acid a,c-diamide adenosyltransferase [Desulfuromonas soudanensis]|uniref:corrinoid adenosyltransferase n=1 Tax=Desulfuromonas soudanensis TaxID=1603606 RepID=A0A0M4CZL3_9BACT|nr:cob(I)yrinic acid a,c-diamide adenosyltransferase [Desulfuromonas soudanensis]ALC18178.1 cob(I)yrinic acid a,c-diamide adenosyltransferase [Desulfuromonas soudanensis]
MTAGTAKELKVRHLDPKKRQGLVVVITGDGKGKTTSALGMALRACGHDMRVGIVQFMKGDMYAGEWDGVKKIEGDIELLATGMGFVGLGGNSFSFEEHREAAQKALELVRARMAEKRYDLLILDEINNALKLGLLDLDQVLSLLSARPFELHLVLTGRDADPAVMEIADTVSEVREIKHAFRRKIEPQPGIDY